MVRKVLSTFLTVSLLLITQIGFGQAPEGVNYQAVARDGSGDVLTNTNLTVRMTIKEGGPAGTMVYQETHNTNTNDFGLFDLVVGKGTTGSGTFSNINWGNSSYFLQVEVDPDGSGFVNLGTTKFVSVPYALYAKEAGNAGTSYNAGTGINISGNTIENTGDTDPTDDITNTSNAGGDVSGTFNNLTVEGIQGRPVANTAPGNGQVLKWNGSQWVPDNDVGGGTGDNWGTQVVQSDATLTGNGTTGNELSVDGDLTDDQTLSISGNDLSISGGNTVTLPGGGSGDITAVNPGTGLSGGGTSGSVTLDADHDNAIWNADELQGNTVSNSTPGSGDVLKWNGSAWAPATDATGGGSIWNQSGNDINYTTGSAFVGRTSAIGSNEVFGTSSDASGYTGMFVESTQSSGKPYYGYSIGGAQSMWTYYNGNTANWHVYNGGERLTVADDGNVGIGTAAPNFRLEVSGGKVAIGSTGGTMGKLTVNSTESGEEVLRARKDGNTRFIVDENGEVGVHTGLPNNAFTVDGNADITGSLGIGTTSPSVKLEVEEDMSGSANQLVGFYPSNIQSSNDVLEIDAGSGAPDDFQFVEFQRGFNTEFQVMGDGTVNIGMTDGPRDLNIKQNTQNTSEAGIYIERSDNTDNWAILHASTDNLWFKHNDNLASWIEPNGTYQSSDRRVKDDIKPVNQVLDRVNKLQASSYYYKTEENDRQRSIGFIAQDVQNLFPEVVGYEEDADRYGVNYGAISVLAIKAIQEQQGQIDDLKQENQQLKQRLNSLEKRVEQLEK